MMHRFPVAPLALLALGALAAPASAQPTAGPETFIGVQAGLNDPGRVVASGPVTAVGTDQVVNDNEDIYHFPAGDITIDHAVSSSSQNFNPTTCIFRLRETGTTTIVSGTGAFAGITGRGTYRVRIFSHGCGPTPDIFVFLLRVQGQVSVAG